MLPYERGSVWGCSYPRDKSHKGAHTYFRCVKDEMLCSAGGGVGGRAGRLWLEVAGWQCSHQQFANDITMLVVVSFSLLLIGRRFTMGWWAKYLITAPCTERSWMIPSIAPGEPPGLRSLGFQKLLRCYLLDEKSVSRGNLIEVCRVSRLKYVPPYETKTKQEKPLSVSGGNFRNI